MTRETKVGLAAVAAVVGLIGWSVAEGVANRPKTVEVRPVVPPENDASIAADRAGAAACCKNKSHPADHSNCRMKEPASASAPPGDSAKCPYLSGKSPSSASTDPKRPGAPRSGQEAR